MNRFKQILAGLLAATIIWLAYVLSSSVGFVFAILSVFLAALLLACFKIKSPRLKIFAFIITIIATLYIPSSFHKLQDARESEFGAMWHKFDEAEIKQQVVQGKVVVIDVTANWCITCKFNKIRVLHDKEIMAKLREPFIFAMRGDITKSNPAIMDYLRKNNRFAIPFNAVYGPKAPNGIILSELLTKDELLAAIKKAQ
jgi:suppressor for copper-sensitivity B